MKVRLPLRLLILVLCAGGVYVLSICAYVLVHAWLFQRTASATFAIPRTATTIVKPLTGSTIGKLEIDRLKLSVMVVEGTSQKSLMIAAGHIEGTALPGEPGNTAVSAHRDTYFRPLRNVRQEDVLTFTTKAGRFLYRVVSISIVDAEDHGILKSTQDQSLTLVTCYPFNFVGFAPERYIVRAERVL